MAVIAGQYLPDWPDLAALVGQFPTTLHSVSLDVGAEESVRAAAAAAMAVTDRIDLVISNARVGSPTSQRSIREPQDFGEMHRLCDVNALGALRVVGALLPLTDKGSLKRLCFVSSEAGSIVRAQRTAWFGYCMSKAALNMATRLLFNDPHPQGYTFRVYHPGWIRGYMDGQKNPRLPSRLDPWLYGWSEESVSDPGTVRSGGARAGVLPATARR